MIDAVEAAPALHLIWGHGGLEALLCAMKRTWALRARYGTSLLGLLLHLAMPARVTLVPVK